MNCNENDVLSWCCIKRQIRNDDNRRIDSNSRTTNVPLIKRSTKEDSLPVEKVKKRKEENREEKSEIE